ncbi:transcription termination factor Rho [Patescibacteria group bacterium]|nr:transcription termination factor Rho [Patescibacteria group bacterium]
MPIRKNNSGSRSGSYNGSYNGGNRNNDSGNSQRRQYNNDDGQSSNYSSGNHASTNYNSAEMIPISGILEVLQDFGIIRQDERVSDELPKDVYTSLSQIRACNLRMGDFVTGFARAPNEGERYLSLLKVEKVDGMSPEDAKKRPLFSKLTPVFPDEWLKLETDQEGLATRLIDLVAPIGKGQRAMIVAPPKAGKTWLLKEVAHGITKNHPDIVLMVALIGERPEEVTDFKRSVTGEVFASNFDEKPEMQTRIAEVCLERSKRLAEKGKDVVILMDSLTRLARAYNMVVQPSGRTLSGGFDPSALYPAKHFFGAARNFEDAGSLTIIATALLETGSRMDDVIFEEFKGTGNMELKLDRSLGERKIYPAVDIKASSTRREDKLYDKKTLEKIYVLRRMVDLLDDKEATELVLQRLRKTKDNKEFLDSLTKVS